MKEVIARIVDGSRFDEYKAEYGKTLVCGTRASVDFPWALWPISSCTCRRPIRFGRERIQFGGVIYADSREKAARFVMDCNQNLVPLIFLHDVNGFMVGRDASGAESSRPAPRW